MHVRKLIDQQHVEAVRILSEVVTELKRKDEEHKSLFRGKSTAAAFHLATYAIEKISEDLQAEADCRHGWMGCRSLENCAGWF